jgi:hypothetical protein
LAHAVLGDLDAGVEQHRGEGFASELRSLIGVEDSRRALKRERLVDIVGKYSKVPLRHQKPPTLLTMRTAQRQRI